MSFASSPSHTHTHTQAFKGTIGALIGIPSKGVYGYTEAPIAKDAVELLILQRMSSGLVSLQLSGPNTFDLGKETSQDLKDA